MSTFGTGTFGEGRFGDPSYEFVDGQYKRVAWRVRWDEGYEGKVGFAVPELEDMRYAAPQMEQGELPTAFALNPDDLLPGRVEGGGGLGHIAAETIIGTDIQAESVHADRLVSNSITATQIEAGSITSNELSVASLDAITGRMGELAAGIITLDGSTLTPGSGSGEDLSALIQTSDTDPRVIFDADGITKTSADGTTALSLGPGEDLIFGVPVNETTRIVQDFNSYTNGSIEDNVSALGSAWQQSVYGDGYDFSGGGVLSIGGTSPNKYAHATQAGTDPFWWGAETTDTIVSLETNSALIIELDFVINTLASSDWLRSVVYVNDIEITLEAQKDSTSVGSTWGVACRNAAYPDGGQVAVADVVDDGLTAGVHDIQLVIESSGTDMVQITVYKGSSLLHFGLYSVSDISSTEIREGFTLGALIRASASGLNNSIRYKKISYATYNNVYEDRSMYWSSESGGFAASNIAATYDEGEDYLTSRNRLKLSANNPDDGSAGSLIELSTDATDYAKIVVAAGEHRETLLDSAGQSTIQPRNLITTLGYSTEGQAVPSNSWETLGFSSHNVSNYGVYPCPYGGGVETPINGLYLITATVVWIGTAEGWVRYFQILRNGSNLVSGTSTETTVGLSIGTQQNLVAIAAFNRNDYFTLRVYHQSGNTFNTGISSSNFALHLLSPL